LIAAQHGEKAGRSPAACARRRACPVIAHPSRSSVDHSISRTINAPAVTSYAGLARLYRRTNDEGLKGCATFRLGVAIGIVPTSAHKKQPLPQSDLRVDYDCTEQK
jgi:hypothetical protein